MIKRLLSIVLLFSIIGKSYSQTHKYEFKGDFTGTGPTLSEVLHPAPCAGSNGSFTSQVIPTSAGNTGPSQQVFLYQLNSGLSYSNASFINGTYTIHVLYKVDDYNAGSPAFQKLIDFRNGSSDDGLYTTGGPSLVNVVGVAVEHSQAITNAANYHLISIVRTGTTRIVEFYIDGTLVYTYDDHDIAHGGVAGTGSTLGTYADVYASNGTDPIILFRDDVGTTFPCESGSGAIRYLSLTNAAADATQVQSTWLILSAALLPVNLTTFTAQKNTNSITVQWQSSNEANAAYYNVEKSYDGQNFTSVAKVNAKNISSSSYSYDDLSAISLTSSYTYYRLKMVDANGNFKYSSIVKVANGKETKVTVFPNPATNFITISGLNNKDEVRLLSIDGKVLSQQTTAAQSMIMNIEKYKPGTYIIQVKNDTKISQEKFVKY